MKKKLAMLFVVIMILSCMPVMAATVPAGADAATETVTTQAATGWRKVGKNYRYYYAAGKYYKNCVKKIGSQLYGFNDKGNLCCGWFRIKTMTFYASVKQGAPGVNKGQILTGYRKIGNDYYYLHPQKGGARASGFITVKGKLLYFNPSGGKQVRTKGWITVGKYMYYVKADGSIATNTTIDGHKIGANGAVSDPYGYDRKAQGYSSETRYLILVNKSTKNGKYGRKDFKGTTAFYAFRINAGNFFHSVLYRKGCSNPYTSSPVDATLGKSISNSCIRLPLADAKFIWDNMKRGTRVVVY